MQFLPVSTISGTFVSLCVWGLCLCVWGKSACVFICMCVYLYINSFIHFIHYVYMPLNLCLHACWDVYTISFLCWKKAV